MKWIKPNGTEIETNDSEETIAYCESLGWKRKEEEFPISPYDQPLIMDPPEKKPTAPEPMAGEEAPKPRIRAGKVKPKSKE